MNRETFLICILLAASLWARADDWNSAILMRRLGISLVATDLMLGRSTYAPPTTEDLDLALAALPDGIRAARKVNRGWCDTLLSAKAQQLEGETRQSYVALYQKWMTKFLVALLNLRTRLESERARPLAERDARNLRELRDVLKELTIESHRELKAFTNAPDLARARPSASLHQ